MSKAKGQGDARRVGIVKGRASVSAFNEIVKPFDEAEVMLRKYWSCCPDEFVQQMSEDLVVGCAQDRGFGDSITEQNVRQFRRHWETKWHEWMLKDPNGVFKPVRNYYRQSLAN
jgi:hypothetical protein